MYAHRRAAEPAADGAYAPSGERVNRPPRTFGPGPATLLCDGRPVAPVAVAEDSAARGRGLLGTDGIVGALWITRCPSVHMVGMRYPIDVAMVDRDGVVLQVTTLRPWTGATWPAPRRLRDRRGGGRSAGGVGRTSGVAAGVRTAILRYTVTKRRPRSRR